LCPVFNVEPRWLLAAIASVQRQVYPRWELCLADDASTDPATIACLDALPKDARIKLIRRTENGHICAATNSAAELATGEFVAFLDNDDELAPHALFHLVERLQSYPEADLLYTDEDKITATGEHFDLHFKPDWSPELLLSYNYINHFTCVRKALLDKVGRLRIGYHGAQDYDLLLRVTEVTDKIQHIPKVLYHWRAIASSSAMDSGGKGIIQQSVAQSLPEALNRRKLSANIYSPEFAQKLGLPIRALDGPDEGPSVAIIVRGPRELATRTVQALEAHTTYQTRTTFLVLDSDNPAESLNQMAAARGEDFLLFLEAGLEAVEPRWLSRMLANYLPGVGIVGGRIMSGGDRLIASAGTVMTDRPRDAFHGLKPNPVSSFFLAESTRNVFAPGQGCLLVSRKVFDQLGGFDTTRFPYSLYDVDLALRAAGQGLRAVHVGEAVLRTRAVVNSRQDSPVELKRLRKAYGNIVDPYHNPNCDPHEPFAIPTGLLPKVKVARRRVLFVTHNLSGFEGAPKVLAEVALGLHAKPIEAVVYSPVAGPMAEKFRTAGIEVHAEPSTYAIHFSDGQWSPRDYEAAIRSATQCLRRVKPDLVLVNTLGMFPVVEACARLNIPVQWVIHEGYREDVFHAAFNDYSRRRCERAFLLAERVIFVSGGCLHHYSGYDGRKNFAVIHNSLDHAAIEAIKIKLTRDAAAQQFYGDPTKVRFLTLGTICERKAQHTLVEAAAIVSQTRRDFRCLLVGARPGLPYLDYVQALIHARGIADVVEIVPETKLAGEYLRSADVFVCTSYVEAFSLSVLEAEAFGLPIISTDCTGISEQVVWGQNALLVEFGDAKSLASAMLELLRNPAKRNLMGQMSLAISQQQMTPEAMLEHYRQSMMGVA
jgi:O-antigen biosynthesis protein